jgi:hypothetical protein
MEGAKSRKVGTKKEIRGEIMNAEQAPIKWKTIY